MGWESRSRGGRYYTRSRRVGGRVVREYVGGGLLGELAAQQDAHERQARQQQQHTWLQVQARVQAADATLADLCERTDFLVRAALLSAGYHQHHRGDWRRRRDTA
jgi:hypothetical protein